MKFQGAVIKEQGVTFAVVIVKKNVIDNSVEARKSHKFLSTNLPSYAYSAYGTGLTWRANLLRTKRYIKVYGECSTGSGALEGVYIKLTPRLLKKAVEGGQYSSSTAFFIHTVQHNFV